MSSSRIGLALIGFVGICLLVGFLGSLITNPQIGGWYAGLKKPSWNPPNWAFGPVWTALYLLMGIAAWLVWREVGFAGGSIPLALFFFQLLLNLNWTWIFFGLQLPGWAFLELIILWLAILGTMISFWRIVPLAGWLFIPYIAWVTYAAALNFAIWRMNV